MDIDIKWHNSITMEDGTKDKLVYIIPNMEMFIKKTGVYMFCRRYGEKVIPIYIGKSKDVGSRLKNHLNSLRMMNAIRDALSGERLFIFGEIICKSGQQAEKCINLVEKAMIEHALTSGYELINEKGTKTPSHTINFNGNMDARAFTSTKIYLKAK